MFQKFLPTPPPPPSTSPKPANMSPKKTLEDSQVSSPEQIYLSNQQNYVNVKSNEEDGDIPDLILPPCPPSEIVMHSNETKGELSSPGVIHRRHTRDDSLETTISQSMDLSSFIKSLELQQEGKQNQQLGDDANKKASEQPPSGSASGSLSLAASQVDISLANDTEDIQLEMDRKKSERIIASTASDNTNKSTTKKPKSSDDSEPIVSEELTEKLMVDHLSPRSSSHSRRGKSSSDSPHTMSHLGDQLLLPSTEPSSSTTTPSIQRLARGHKVTPSTGTASKISENTMSKGNGAKKVVKFMIFVVVILAFVFGGGGDGSPNNTTETTALSDQASLLSNLPIQDIRHSQKTDLHENDYERVWQDSSNYAHEERTDKIKEEETNASISGAVTSHESFLQDTSNLLVDEITNTTNGEPHNSSEASKGGSRGWASFIFVNIIMILHVSFWPVALLFVAYQLFSSVRLALVSPPSSKEKIKVEAKMEPTTPATPTGPRRNRNSFLTPPLSCKNGAKEPTEWMSPCYGEDAIDVSVYKSMKATELRELLRDRKYDTRGDKEKMIKMLVLSYQNELACLTVQQLRPKLRRRNLSQKGTKKDIVRRLVEAGPSCR